MNSTHRFFATILLEGSSKEFQSTPLQSVFLYQIAMEDAPHFDSIPKKHRQNRQCSMGDLLLDASGISRPRNDRDCWVFPGDWKMTEPKPGWLVEETHTMFWEMGEHHFSTQLADS